MYEFDNPDYSRQQEFSSPYDPYDPYVYDNTPNDFPCETLTTKPTNNLIMVTRPQRARPVTYGHWMPASESEPVVKNKEMDDWVLASSETRCRGAQSDDTNVPDECSYDTYISWKKSQGVSSKVGVSKKGKGYTAAGKHPIGALKEKVPSCEFAEETRERNDELRFWKLTASVTFNGYKFLGYGVTMKIAKAEAAVKALTYLDAPGMQEMIEHIGEPFYQKQALLEAVMDDEQQYNKIQEPWYLKVGDSNEDIPVFKPKELPTPHTHPVMFLHQFYGPDIVTDFQLENPGFRPIIYSCTITVQGTAFQGQGPSKKEAQKITAALILRKYETNPPPLERKTGPKKKKRKKNVPSVADLPTIPSVMPTVDQYPGSE